MDLNYAVTRKKTRRRRRGACLGCKERKVRCDGAVPCSQCKRNEAVCQYIKTIRTGESKSTLVISDVQPQISSGTIFDWRMSHIDETLAIPFGSEWNSVAYASTSDASFDPGISGERLETNDPDIVTQFIGTPMALSINELTPFQISPFPEDFACSLDSAYLSPDFLWEDTQEGCEKIAASMRSQLFGSKAIHEALAAIQKLTNRGNRTSIRRSYSQRSSNKDETWPTRAQWQGLCDLLFSDPSNYVGAFLEKPKVYELVNQVCERRDSRPETSALAHALFALGLHAQKEDSMSEINAKLEKNDQLHKALFFSGNFNHNYTVISLQALTTLVICCSLFDNAMVETVLTKAVRCIQQLRLNGGNQRESTFLDNTSLAEANRAYWIIYCLEKQHALYMETFSLIDENWVAHESQYMCYSQEDDNNNPHFQWIMCQIHFTKLGTQIAAIAASRERETLQTRDTAQLTHLRDCLRKWKDSLPEEYHWDTQGPFVTTGVNEVKLIVFCQLHWATLMVEAIFARHHSRIEVHAIQNAEIMVEESEKECIISARTILEASIYMHNLTQLNTQWFNWLACKATYFIFKSIILYKNNRGDLLYLGMACGYFGFVSLTAEVPLTHVLNLSKIAHQAVLKQ